MLAQISKKCIERKTTNSGSLSIRYDNWSKLLDSHHDLEVKKLVNSAIIPKEIQPMSRIYINMARKI